MQHLESGRVVAAKPPQLGRPLCGLAVIEAAPARDEPSGSPEKPPRGVWVGRGGLLSPLPNPRDRGWGRGEDTIWHNLRRLLVQSSCQPGTRTASFLSQDKRASWFLFPPPPPPPPRVLMWVSACELVWRLSAARERVIAFTNFRVQSPLGIDSLPVQYIFALSG